MQSNPVSFEEFSEAKSIPYYAQVFIHYDPNTQPLSKVIEIIERFEIDLGSVKVCDSIKAGLKIATIQLDAIDISHLVIALIENLGLEAYGCGPLIAGSVTA